MQLAARVTRLEGGAVLADRVCSVPEAVAALDAGTWEVSDDPDFEEALRGLARAMAQGDGRAERVRSVREAGA